MLGLVKMGGDVDRTCLTVDSIARKGSFDGGKRTMMEVGVNENLPEFGCSI